MRTIFLVPNVLALALVLHTGSYAQDSLGQPASLQVECEVVFGLICIHRGSVTGLACVTVLLGNG